MVAEFKKTCYLRFQLAEVYLPHETKKLKRSLQTQYDTIFLKLAAFVDFGYLGILLNFIVQYGKCHDILSTTIHAVNSNRELEFCQTDHHKLFIQFLIFFARKKNWMMLGRGKCYARTKSTWVELYITDY